MITAVQQMLRIREALRIRASARSAAALTLVMTAAVCLQIDGSAQSDRRRQARLDRALAREGEALAEIADAAARGRRPPADFPIAWRNDFFKAHPGTFVPFTITFDGTSFVSRHALMYVRAERRLPAGLRPPPKHRQYAYETIFPFEIRGAGGDAFVQRGFAVPPGTYRLTVVIREASPDPLEPLRTPRKASALLQDLEVPDFWTGGLTTSSVILADRLERLPGPVPADELDEDPYVVGTQRIHPTQSRSFSRNRELIVVFLVYNPTVAPDKHFDVQVDYHLYRQNQREQPSVPAGDHPAPRAGEQYVTRTSPQRFNPSLMGGQFDPGAGAPVLAGQAILLSAFEPGEYRLGITVTDLLSRASVSRDVAFTVIGS